MSQQCPPWQGPELPHLRGYVLSAMSDFHAFASRKCKDYIITHGDIKTWHGRLFERVVPLAYYAGSYRADDQGKRCLQVDVGVGGRSGTPYPSVLSQMREFSARLFELTKQTDEYVGAAPNGASRAIAAVHLAAFAAGRLVQIHPFLNGNGRMSRLTANYFLMRYDYPVLYQQAIDRPVHPTYADASALCMTGDFNGMYKWLLGVLTGQVSATP
ncbi:MAG TPA: Fic family protein [Candidatus Acidoferrales bacterium]